MKNMLHMSFLFSAVVALRVVSPATAGQAIAVIPSNGPYAGGNVVLVTNAVQTIGNGSDITNLLVGAVVTTNILGQGVNWVEFVVPFVGSAGAKNIEIHSTSAGSTIFAGAYTVNPAGMIGGTIADFQSMIAGGYNHSLGLKSDGSIVGWGENLQGQTTDIPSPNSDFVAVAAGGAHSLGLKSDSSIVGWGYNDQGQVNSLSSNSNFVAVAAGEYHSLGLKSDGSIVGWGRNYYGQTDIPSPNSDFVAVAAGAEHSLGLKSDGSIVAWGYNYYGQTNIPSPNSDFVAVAGGYNHSLGLKSDGSIVGWGRNGQGQTDIPLPNSDFVAVAAGYAHSLGLKSDGSIVGWGFSGNGLTNIPSPNSDFVAVAAGGFHSLGLKSDGSIVVWGSNDYGQTNIASPNTSFGMFPVDPVAPSSGAWTGGYLVVISGTNLGNGTDITNVTLCGVNASIQSQSATQVVVTAGTSALAGMGAVRVYSTSFGETVKSNAFEYLHAAQYPLVFTPTSPQTYNTTNALSVSGGSGTGAVSYAVSSGPGAIVGGTKLWVSAGTGIVTVVATKAQDNLYLATSTTSTVAAAKAAQSITFPNPGPQVTTNVTPIVATASSGLPVALAVISGPATLSATVSPATIGFISGLPTTLSPAALTYSGAGVVTIAATQAGDANWQAALSVTNTFTVSLPVQPELASPVHRFWSDSLMSHFYTASEDEKNSLINSKVWSYEGIAFYAYTQAQEDTQPVHRFWSERLGAHLFTISDKEKSRLESRFPKAFMHEGHAFHVFNDQALGTLPVYRFWNPTSKRVFFTISEDEKANVIASQIWRFEGIAWYAYPTANIAQPPIPTKQDQFATQEDTLPQGSDVDSVGVPAGEVSFSLTYDGNSVVEATLYDPATNGFTQVLVPTVAPHKLEIPSLPAGQRYWLSVMSRQNDDEGMMLDYGGWLGKVAEMPEDAIETVEEGVEMHIGLPVETIALPESKGTLALRLYERTGADEDLLIVTRTGLKGGSACELAVPAWNSWYRIEIADETSGVVLESFWIGHLRTH